MGQDGDSSDRFSEGTEGTPSHEADPDAGNEIRRLEAELQRVHQELARRLAEIDELNRRLREQAIRDPLTQLHNRRYFDEAIQREAARLVRTNEPLSLALVDVDRFKLVNDLRGHAAGDLVLRRLADVLRALVRGSDLVCRIGGEEFVVVMVGATNQVAMTRAETWRKAFAAEPIEVDKGGPLSCTLSVGVAEHRERYEPIERTLARAEEALYFAKKAGRNRVISADATGETEPPEPR